MSNFPFFHYAARFFSPVSNRKILSVAAWSILFLAVCWSFLHVFLYAVDVPHWDEWDYLYSVENFSWTALLDVHVQHRIFFTRLLFYLSWLADGLNIRHLILVNYLVYLAMVASVLLVLREKFADWPWYPLFFLPFFSDLPSENLLWAGQSQFHFMLLFAMLAIHFGFNKPDTTGNRLLLCIFLVLSIFSMSPAFSAVILFVWTCRRILLYFQEKDAAKRKNILQSGILTILLAAGGILLFFVHYVPDTGIPSCSPLLFRYWLHLRFSLARVFSLVIPDMDVFSRYFLYFSGILIVFYLIRFAWKRPVAVLREQGAPLCIILWGISFSMLIIYSRGSSLADRHLEAVLAVVPATASILAQIPEIKKRRIILAAYLAGVLFALCWSFSFEKAKRDSIKRFAGYEMLLKWKEFPEGKLKISQLYPVEFSEQGRRALRLKLSCLEK